MLSSAPGKSGTLEIPSNCRRATSDPARRCDAGGERIALYKIGGEIYATSEMCSHSDCSLEDSARSSKAIKSNASVTAQGSASRPAK
jgi:nitrite reductase/ring-hydroxylating ferredoxin subunit